MTLPYQPWKGAWRVSSVPEDVCVVAGSFGPSVRDLQYHYTVRDVTVYPLDSGSLRDNVGRMYRRCIFPDGRVMLVNEGNIIARRVGRYDANNGKAPSGSDGGDQRSAG